MEDNLMTDRQLVLDFVGKLQNYLDERKAEGYPPRLDYAAEFTPAFVNSLKTAVANIQKYVEAEKDYGFALELADHVNIYTLLEAMQIYGSMKETRYLAEAMREMVTDIGSIERQICAAVLGGMVKAEGWKVYGKEIIKGKNTPNLEEKRPIPTNILQSKLSAAEGKYASSREPQRAKKGRPKGKTLAFADKIICKDKDGLLKELHIIIEANPNDYGSPLKAAGICLGVGEKLNMFYGITYNDMCKEFGIKSKSSGNFSRYRSLDRLNVAPPIRKKMEDLLKKYVSNSNTGS